MKKIFTFVLTILFAISCLQVLALGENTPKSHASSTVTKEIEDSTEEKEGKIFYVDFIKYEEWMSEVNDDKTWKCVRVCDILEGSGPDVTLPETVTYEGVEYRVNGITYPYWWKIFDHVKSLHIPKYMSYFFSEKTYDSPVSYWIKDEFRTYDPWIEKFEPRILQFAYYFPNLEWCEVDKDNNYIRSADGCIYSNGMVNHPEAFDMYITEKDDFEHRFTHPSYMLNFIPPKWKSRDGVFTINKDVGFIDVNMDIRESLIINMKEDEIREIKILSEHMELLRLQDLLNVETIQIIDGETPKDIYLQVGALPKLKYVDLGSDNDILCDFAYLPSLRELRIGTVLPTLIYKTTTLPSLVKLARTPNLDSAHEIRLRKKNWSWQEDIPDSWYGLMYYDLRDLDYIEELGIDRAQSVYFGERLGKTDKKNAPHAHWEWMEATNPYHVDICIESETPPVVDLKGMPADYAPDWTLYVPEVAVESYRQNDYWGRAEILPITDKLIPLVSEPELTIEEGQAHEYLWDVMPIGNAVACESGKWEVRDPDIVQIEGDGVLYALKTGKTEVTFTLEDTEGNEYRAVSEVTVIEAGSGVKTIEAEEATESETTQSAIPDGVYNLHGQRVGDSTEGLVPGLYIVVRGGKTEKLMVK